MNGKLTNITGVVVAALVVVMAVAGLAVLGGTAVALSDGDSAVESIDGPIETDSGVVEHLATNESIDNANIAVPDAYVDPAIEAEDDEVQVLVRLAGADIGVQTAADVAERELKTHAERTQAPVLDHIERASGMTATNSFWITNMIVADVDPGSADLDALVERDGVQAVYKSREIPEPTLETDTANLDDKDTTYGLDMISAPDVWQQFGTQGEGARVAVIDNGIDPEHPDLDLYTEDPDDPTYPGGFALFDGEGEQVEDAEPESGSGHGDHTSGTVAGGSASDTHIGVAPEAELLHADVFRLQGTDATVIASMEWAAERDADVASLSLGFGCTSPIDEPEFYLDSLIDPIENVRASGTLVVAATGNAGEGCVGGLGNDYGTFGVGNVDENRDVHFSSSGQEISKDNWEDPPEHWPDVFIEPDVAAPGTNVLSAGPDGDGYTESTGTSMAAPHVSGVAALIRSLNPEATVEDVENALVNSATKPERWSEPDDQPDTRYGYGIIDALESSTIVGGGIQLGDVTRTGEVTIDDAVAIQRGSLGLDPGTPYVSGRADLTRDGQATITDAVRAQSISLGLADGPMLNVDHVDAAAELSGDQIATVNATLNNTGDVGALQTAELILVPEGESVENGTVVNDDFVDVAVPGVLTPVDRPAVSNLTLTLDTGPIDAGEYDLVVSTEQDQHSTSVTVREPVFEFTSVDAPRATDQADGFNVTIEVTNVGNEPGTQTVAFTFLDTDRPSLDEELSLGPGNSTELTFEVDTSDIRGGTYSYAVTTANDERTDDIVIRQPVFDVTSVDGPEGVFLDEPYTVTATITNTGEAPDEQSIEYRLTDGSIAVVDVEDSPHSSELVETIDGDPRFEVDLLHASNVTDEIDEYDGFVVQQFGSNDVADAFLDELGSQGVVYLDTFQGLTQTDYADGVYRLNEVRNDPVDRGEVASDAGTDPAMLDIQESHPIFDGVGDPGDTVEMYDSQTDETWGSWFEGYSGTVLGDLDLGNDFGGSSVAVGENDSEVLLTAAGRSGFTNSESFTDEADTLLTNAIDYVVTGDTSIRTAATGPETVQLDPGENETVTFDRVTPADQPLGDTLHLVNSEDSSAAAPTQVRDGDFFEIVDLDVPSEAKQNDSITVETTVQNNGLETGTQDIEYLFDGEVVDVETAVELDPNETVQIVFEHTIDPFQTPGPTEHGVQTELDEATATIDVIELEDAMFEVTAIDGPQQRQPGDSVTVDATITNTGERSDTQVVSYSFIATETPVAFVDNDPDAHGVDDAAATLNNTLGVSFDVEVVNATESDLIAEMSQYDVFVVNHFGDTDVGAFLDELSADQGAVYLDAWDEDEANAIRAVADERADPSGATGEFNGGSPTRYEITQDHPVFAGVGSVDDSVEINTGDSHRTEFDSYDGDIVGDAGSDGFIADSGVGVDDARNEVLLGAHGITSYTAAEDLTDDAEAILANAVGYVGELVQPESEIQTASLTDASSETIELSPGEATELTFEDEIPVVTPPGSYQHRVESANDTGTSAFEVEAITAIAGSVTDVDTGEPIDGATVSGDGDGQFTTTTDADGEYLVHVDPGTYVVNVDADGYQPDRIISVDENEVVIEDFELSAIAGNITGTVTTEDGTPIEGATVEDADGNAFEVQTDADGEYLIEDLTAGVYAVQATADGFEDSRIRFVELEGEDVEQDFTLSETSAEMTDVKDLTTSL